MKRKAFDIGEHSSVVFTIYPQITPNTQMHKQSVCALCNVWEEGSANLIFA